VPEPAASVIIRTYHSATTLDAAIDSVRHQTVPVEIVVVDSGSTRDGTLEIARRRADVVVEMSHDEFTFGRSLNLGAARASAPVHVALSSHCVLPRADWVEIACQHIAAGAVATYGTYIDGDRTRLAAPLHADGAYLRAHPHWGLSNTASAWAAAAWREHRFDETLGASEDKEWSSRAIDEHDHLVADPRLVVAAEHRRAGGARAYYRRLLAEGRAREQRRRSEPYGALRALGDWGRQRPTEWSITESRPFGRTRLLEVAARWQTGRESRRDVSPQGR
jgi:rhamnosyltransferase